MTLYNFLMTYNFEQHVAVKIHITKDETKEYLLEVDMDDDEVDKRAIIEYCLNDDFTSLEVTSIEPACDGIDVYVIYYEEA